MKPFLKGMIEFRLTYTTAYEDLYDVELYDRGREFAHKITFRHFEP